MSDALTEAKALLRGLLDSLPRCSFCSRAATRAHGRGGDRFCDEHAAASRCSTPPPYPRAPWVRKAEAWLGKEAP
jgi:hypothetical protein